MWTICSCDGLGVQSLPESSCSAFARHFHLKFMPVDFWLQTGHNDLLQRPNDLHAEEIPQMQHTIVNRRDADGWLFIRPGLE